MHEFDPDQERFAGLVDGMRAGFSEAVSAVRREIARFGLEIDGKLQIRQAEGRISIAPEPGRMPDNPLGHSGYSEGWEVGRVIGNRDGRLRIRQALVSFGLFLATDDRVTTVEVASALVAMARGRDKQHSLELIQDDKALHAFLDDVQFSAHGQRPGAQAESPKVDNVPEPAPAPPPHPARQIPRGWKMVKENVNRRTAIAALLGALTAGWFGLAPKSSSPDKGRVDPTAEGPLSTQSGYVPPTTWDNLPPGFRSEMLAWDQVTWTFEQAQSPSPVIAGIVTSVMSQPQTMDRYKQLVAHFLLSSQRDGYWQELAIGLAPHHSSVNARINLLTALEHRIRVAGPGAIPAPVFQVALQQFQAGTESHESVIELLDAILTAGGIPH